MENIVTVDVVMERLLNSVLRPIDSRLAKISTVFALSISKKHDMQVTHYKSLQNIKNFVYLNLMPNNNLNLNS